jgi:hypothetical protein
MCGEDSDVSVSRKSTATSTWRPVLDGGILTQEHYEASAVDAEVGAARFVARNYVSPARGTSLGSLLPVAQPSANAVNKRPTLQKAHTDSGLLMGQHIEKEEKEPGRFLLPYKVSFETYFCIF